MDQEQISALIKQLLDTFNCEIGPQILKETPGRVARAYTEMFNGYRRSFKDEVTVFDNKHGYSEIIYSGKIHFFSTCEHHLLPFFGIAHIAYIPNKHIVGLSKLSRVVDIYARRLQQQERITMQVADELEQSLEPQGVAVLLEGTHLCNTARGIKQFDSNMKTMAFTGIFREDQKLCDRFLRLAT